MTEYIIAYYGGSEPSTPEEGMAHMEQYKKWLSDLGDAVVNPAVPLGASLSVTTDSVTECDKNDALKGYTVIKAENIDAAVAIAQQCPFLDIGGRLEVAEIKDMPSA